MKRAPPCPSCSRRPISPKARTRSSASASAFGRLSGADVETLVVSEAMPESVEAVRALVPEGTTAVLIGRSGVGKSSLVNLLVGRDVQETGTVRETDGAGRHTTVSREMVSIPHGGYVVDMPGVRGLGLWDADAGIGVAFADVEELAEQCRFRDCKHENEPGCAVRAAVERGESRAGALRVLRFSEARDRGRPRAPRAGALDAARAGPGGIARFPSFGKRGGNGRQRGRAKDIGSLVEDAPQQVGPRQRRLKLAKVRPVARARGPAASPDARPTSRPGPPLCFPM